MQPAWRTFGLVLSLALLGSCADSASTDSEELEELPVSAQRLDAAIVLPNTRAILYGTGFLDGALYEVTLSGDVGEVSLVAERLDDTRLALSFPSDAVRSLPPGPFRGLLRVVATLGIAQGVAELAVSLEISTGLTPTLQVVPNAVFPASPVTLRGAGFISGSEGSPVVELRGSFTADSGAQVEVNVEAAPTTAPQSEGWARDEIAFIFHPDWVGIELGHLSGELRVHNRGEGWQQSSDWVPVEFDLLPPTIEDIGVAAASRGQAVPIIGKGFVGGEYGGTTVLTINGIFERRDGESVMIENLELTPAWLSGERLVFSFQVRYDRPSPNRCESNDLGANPGRFSNARVEVATTYKGVTVRGSGLPLNFEVLPTKQVVYLQFLPAFTDSLRLFGLRNVSRAVIDRVLEVMRRDYLEFNVEIRDIEPADFLEYSIVQIGGPDPNGGALFGLDNTTGKDTCNQRLDDFLAGRNADADGLFGGIFVESVLQLSPALNPDNPISDARFDEIFDPVHPVRGTAAEPGEWPNGPRAEAIGRAITTLGNLVGNTASHEVGHSLGLSVTGGCGEFHNAPGDLQIMDCGRDRPFEERAELGPPGTWTPENRTYMLMILAK